MNFLVQIARDVRFGSLADILAINSDVRFTPNSGHSDLQAALKNLDV
jgi:hypothetical protein